MFKKRYFKCENCGRIFTEDEIKFVEESRGEFWGVPCTETMSYSPCCTDNFEELEEEPEDD